MEIVSAKIDLFDEAKNDCVYWSDILGSRGYSAMCKWMVSDDDLLVLRGFGELSARVLLRLRMGSTAFR